MKPKFILIKLRSTKITDSLKLTILKMLKFDLKIKKKIETFMN